MENKNKNSFHSALKLKMDKYAYEVYKNTKNFPKDEIFGRTSQLRRFSLSVILNCIEGYARLREKQYRNFFLAPYASLKESKYLL
jgi:four helix bundle protein